MNLNDGYGHMTHFIQEMLPMTKMANSPTQEIP
jgi:hypothetical protein